VVEVGCWWNLKLVLTSSLTSSMLAKLSALVTRSTLIPTSICF